MQFFPDLQFANSYLIKSSIFEDMDWWVFL